MITAAMLAEAFTETTEPEHRTEVPPFSEAPDEVVQHFQRAADYLNTRSNPPQEERSDPLGLAAADDNHKALVEELEDLISAVLPFAADCGLAGLDGVSRERAVERAKAALAAFQSRQEESR